MAKVTVHMDMKGPDYQLQHQECFIDGLTGDVKVTKSCNVGFSTNNEKDSLPCNNGGQFRMYKGNYQNYGICLTECLVRCPKKKAYSIQRHSCR